MDKTISDKALRVTREWLKTHGYEKRDHAYFKLELLNKEPPHHERKLKEARQYARKYYRQWRDGLVDVAQQRHILKNYVRVATEELTDTEAELKEAQGRYDKLYQQFKGQEERIRELTAGALQKK